MKTHFPSSVRQRLSALLLVIATCLVWSGGAQAQTRIYMDFNNKTPKGGVLNSNALYKDTIELASFQFGSGRGISSPIAGGANREASAPSISEISVTSSFDPLVYPDLFLASCIGKEVPVKIYVVSDAGGNGASFEPLKIELENGLISGFSSSASTGDSGAGFFNISLNFTKITLTTTPLDPRTGQPGPPVVKFYDLATAKGG